MTEPTIQLDPACRQRIDRHLDAVDQALQAGGVGRGERRQIADDLQNQILEMLAARAGKTPKLADIEAILTELDPPEAYGRDPITSSPNAQGLASVPANYQSRPASFWFVVGLVALAIGAAALGALFPRFVSFDGAFAVAVCSALAAGLIGLWRMGRWWFIMGSVMICLWLSGVGFYAFFVYKDRVTQETDELRTKQDEVRKAQELPKE